LWILKKEFMDEKNNTPVSEKELLIKAYDRYFGLQAEAEKKEFEDMRNRKSERVSQQCTVLYYSQPEGTLEEERSAMKGIAAEVKNYVLSGDPLQEPHGIILARLFFGNYAKQNHPGNRGRGWSDADLSLWLNWIRAGQPGDEWHIYYGQLIK
jgi:hypothetical protein